MVECEQPNNSLYTFTGNLVIGKQTIPISPNQMLLRVSQPLVPFTPFLHAPLHTCFP